MVGQLEETNPLLLEVDIEAEELAERYVKEGIIPERYRNDAVHIAVAGRRIIKPSKFILKENARNGR